ncbi:tRNA (cmo5U34)-methyltransferase [Pedobacter sp. AK017]|uniref:class I SAM-dependent methyltransferase n=1 Tax=Pedobacter sp. AK017 TaxID=2723073 RepID=UPI00184FDA93|nr:class I SAM-dependent methyltransferase [Pedobacter sp. AK017]MBB5437533.1 tRNA (cmo5U34)-methyltransferase [Pedobacter sp. AK017]
MKKKKEMNTDYSQKATNEEIKARFDKDVERFSNLETGQQSTIDAPITMELCTAAAQYINPKAKELLDIGCGAGNYTLNMLGKIPNLNCTLNDLSLPMLERARARVAAQTSGEITILHNDMRNLDLPENHFDIVLAAATFHHLRDDADWELVFTKIYKALKPGGSLWISDLITHNSSLINRLFEDKYRVYLESLGGPEYAQNVFDYIAYEDTPRSLNFQLALLTKVGFRTTEILHKNSNFAAFGAVK